jgi:transposase InsO family protein
MVSGLTQEMYSRLGIEMRTCTAYHPEGNAIVERFNQSLKRMLHHVVSSDEPKNWDRQLPFLLWSYRELPNDTTGVSPHMMVYGQTPKGPLSILKDKWSGSQPVMDKLPNKVEEYLAILKKDLSLCHEVAKDHAKES